MHQGEDWRSQGQGLLQEVALHHASQHGLRPESVEGVLQGSDEWRLKVTAERHSVRFVFSAEEIENYVGGGPGTTGSKGKIRNAFASLAM